MTMAHLVDFNLKKLDMRQTTPRDAFVLLSYFANTLSIIVQDIVNKVTKNYRIIRVYKIFFFSTECFKRLELLNMYNEENVKMIFFTVEMELITME